MELKTIDSKVLSTIKGRYGIDSDEEAIRQVKINIKVLRDLYEQKYHRLYWTSEDKETLQVIQKNAMVAKEILKIMVADLRESEEQMKAAEAEDWEIEIIDNLGAFLEMCFTRDEAGVKETVRRISRTYSIEQLDVLFNILHKAETMLQNAKDKQDIPPLPDDAKFGDKAVHEFLSDAHQLTGDSSVADKQANLFSALATLAREIKEKKNPKPVIKPSRPKAQEPKEHKVVITEEKKEAKRKESPPPPKTRKPPRAQLPVQKKEEEEEDEEEDEEDDEEEEEEEAAEEESDEEESEEDE